MKNMVFLAIITVGFIITGCSEAQVVSSNQIGTFGNIQIVIDNVPATKTIQISESQVTQAVIMLVVPDGSTQTQTWHLGGPSTFYFNAGVTGQYTIGITQTDTSNSVVSTNVQATFVSGYNYFVAVTLGENVFFHIDSGGSNSSSSSQNSLSGQVITLAGSGQDGSTDGEGTNASFSLPYGVVVDSAGNVFVADTGNRKIRKITPVGVVMTFAGSTAGYADGTGTNAKFGDPCALAIDSSDNIYVSDIGNNMIRKITPAGAVTTIPGATGGSGIAVSISGTIYVADTYDHKILKITPEGVITTLAGRSQYTNSNGKGTNAWIGSPYGLAVDSSENVYMSDCSIGLIGKITSDGTVVFLAGKPFGYPGYDMGYADGTGTNAKFNNPMGLALDKTGNIFVADCANGRIRKVTPDGVVTTFAGAGNAFDIDGTLANAAFQNPFGIAVDQDGNFYVSDRYNIRKIIP